MEMPGGMVVVLFCIVTTKRGKGGSTLQCHLRGGIFLRLDFCL